MFRSFDWKYLDYDPTTNQSRYEIIFVDDDFIETTIAASIADYVVVTVSIALIDIYSRRNLNVAGNLVLLMQYIENKRSWADIKWQIEEYQKCIPEYQKYHDQVMDYLVFM